MNVVKNVKCNNEVNVTNKTDWLIEFKTIYQSLTKSNLASLKDIYHNDIYFEDPLHKVEGIDNFVHYFEALYTNIISCHFDIHHEIHTENEAAIYWEMKYQHPKLNNGKVISVSGHSHLKVVDSYIIYHRDYLDAGAMLYEHIPLLGSTIRYIKKRAQS